MIGGGKGWKQKAEKEWHKKRKEQGQQIENNHKHGRY